MAVTIATNVSEKSVAALQENQAELQGIDIVEDSVRKYIDDPSMGPILGYTGQASAEELEELRKKNPDYSNDAIVGKTGIEKSFLLPRHRSFEPGRCRTALAMPTGWRHSRCATEQRFHTPYSEEMKTINLMIVAVELMKVDGSL